MKIKLIKKSTILPNCWKSCGVDKDAWDKLQEGKEIEVKHNSRIHGNSNYGFSRILKVLIDLLYLKFFKNYKRQSIYFFGLFSFFSFILSVIFFIYILILKYNYDTSFIQTPLPLLIIFLVMIGLIFLFIGILAQLIINQGNKNINKHDSIKEKIVLNKK